MSVFFFIQYIIVKRKEHLFYAIYLFVLSVYYVLALPDFFFGINAEVTEKTHFFNLFKRPVQFLSSVFYTLFVIHYLGLAGQSRYLNRIFKFLIGLYLVLSALCLVFNFSNIPYDNAYFLISLSLFPLQFYVLVALFRHQVPYSKYIIWGSIITLVGSSVSLLLTIYAIRSKTFNPNINIFLPVQLSILADMFLFSIALQKKIADNERSLINAAHQRQQAILLERERIIADLHDDVGGGLSSIRMMSDLMAQKEAFPKQGGTSSFAQKISLTAKDIAQRMHTIIWSLNAENDSLENFVEYVRQYGISFFENSGIGFQCHSVNGLKTGIQLNGVKRKNLFLIIKESFHNILKHSGARSAGITISIMKNTLDITIQDDGSGIKNPNQFGNGLKNMKNRMDEIGGNIEISSENGTLIKITANVA
jgi:signal transduction histidine kinase